MARIQLRDHPDQATYPGGYQLLIDDQDVSLDVAEGGVSLEFNNGRPCVTVRFKPASLDWDLYDADLTAT